jgi:hypothetical protein
MAERFQRGLQRAFTMKPTHPTPKAKTRTASKGRVHKGKAGGLVIGRAGSRATKIASRSSYQLRKQNEPAVLPCGEPCRTAPTERILNGGVERIDHMVGFSRCWRDHLIYPTSEIPRLSRFTCPSNSSRLPDLMRPS